MFAWNVKTHFLVVKHNSHSWNFIFPHQRVCTLRSPAKWHREAW